MDFLFEHISVVFDGVPALYDIDFRLPSGGGVVVTGHSGAGKTTLLRLMYGALLPSSGSLSINGTDTRSMRSSRLRKLRSRIGVIFQDASFISSMTAYENAMLPLIVEGHTKRAADSRCLEVMSDLGISYLRDKFPSQLSGGERQVLAAARAFMAYPECIIADEPTGLLDEAAVARIVTALQREHARGATLIVSTHDTLAVQLFHELGHIHLDEGKMLQKREPSLGAVNVETPQETAGGSDARMTVPVRQADDAHKEHNSATDIPSASDEGASPSPFVANGMAVGSHDIDTHAAPAAEDAATTMQVETSPSEPISATEVNDGKQANEHVEGEQ